MLEAIARTTRSYDAPRQSDPLNEVRKDVRADKSKITQVPVAGLELKRSVSTPQKG